MSSEIAGAFLRKANDCALGTIFGGLGKRKHIDADRFVNHNKVKRFQLLNVHKVLRNC